MQTVYDWLTVSAFAGLLVLFLQRSSRADLTDHLWQYLPPAVGCGLANYLGNEGYDVFAVLTLVAVGAYVYYVLKPYRMPGA